MKALCGTAAILISLEVSVGQTTVYDFLPLALGNTWVYEYYSAEGSYDRGLSSRKTQTGRLTITVIDSTFVKADSVVWRLTAHDSAFFQAIDYDYSGNPTKTIEKQVYDTSKFLIGEHLLGTHNLVSNGVRYSQPLFQFPQKWNYANASSGKPVYRYRNDSTEWKLIYNAKGSYSHQCNDTVLLHSGTGISNIKRYEKAGGSPGHSEVSNYFTASLVSSKLTVPPVPGDTTKQDTTKIHIPSQFALGEVFPNPFSNSISFTIDLPAVTDVVLMVFNTLGQLVVTHEEHSMPAGIHTKNWNPLGLPSGMYLIHFRIGSLTAIRPMIYMK